MKTGLKLKLAWSVLAETFAGWNEHKAVRLGAALAYFAIFAIAPVLIIAIGIAGVVYGQAAIEGNIVSSISGVVGSSVIIRLVNPGLAFGAEGALVVILLWVNVVSLILLFGAEFIRVYSRRFGSHAQPKGYAKALAVEVKATQGMPAK